MQKIRLEDVLKKYNIGTPIGDGSLEYMSMDRGGYNLDLFPYIISDPYKYQQVEVFYQKCLDGGISRQAFEAQEQKFHYFVKTLWLYNEVYVMVPLDVERFRISYYRRKNRSKYRKYEKVLCGMMSDLGHMYQISSIELLEAVLFLATREVSQVLFYFKNTEAFLDLEGCQGIIYLHGESAFQKISDLAGMSHLYLLERR